MEKSTEKRIMNRGLVNWYVDGLQQRFYGRKIARRLIRDAQNPFELPATEFQQMYRFTKPMVHYIIEELTQELAPKTQTGLPVYIQVLVSIRFLACGGYQRGIGQDHTLCVSQKTVSKFLAKFVHAVNNRLTEKWIGFPGTPALRDQVCNGFQNKYGLPDILGCIDCTHVAIVTPSENAVQYLNRKRFHSINVQIISDVNCKIINVVARYPGRVHDQFIFNHSNVKNEMKRLYNNRIGNYYLLGDTGYALEPWLMTPIRNAAPGSANERYTNRHCQIRNCVERLNGYIKGSFRCLRRDRVLHYDPGKACEIILTCCTLYNIMLHFRIPMEEYEPQEEIIRDEEINLAHGGAELLRLAESKRERIINQYFTQ